MGSEEFIKKAKKVRKIMGGGMRQSGFLAACGLVSLDSMIERLKEDHENAKYLAEKLSSIPWIKCPAKVDTNIFIFTITNPDITSDMVLCYLDNNNVLGVARSEKKIRFVTHKDVSKDDVDRLADVLKSFEV
jgi:threonine aldolase